VKLCILIVYISERVISPYTT